jgi:protoporphyrinogen oxidase
MAPPGETGVVAEIPYFPEDSIDQLSNRDLCERAITELEQLGLLKRDLVLDWKHDYLFNAYPVYSLDYAEKVQRITDAVSEFKNLDLAGRNGLFYYSHLHDQMRFGKDYIASLSSEGMGSLRTGVETSPV